MNTQTQDRINDLSMSVSDIVMTLSEGNVGAATVLAQMLADPMGILKMLCLDTKRLYGTRIWQLYELCGHDITRFTYHLEVELPNQETGELGVTGPYAPDLDKMEEWFAKRRFGKPNSFWALENPPAEPNYAFPIG